MPLTRKHWLLFLLALQDASEALDPVRLQSGMFMLSREADLPATQRYEFETSDAGPFAATLASDVAELEDEGLVVRDQVAGFTWSEFSVTPKGLEHARELVAPMPEDELGALRCLAGIKQDLVSRSFRELMEHLLRTYPDLASKSIFR